MWNPFKKSGKDGASDGMRSQALSLNSKQTGVLPSSVLPVVWGALLEEGLGGGGYTLLVLGEGTTSLYMFPSGGIIGAGQHESVRKAAETWLADAQKVYESIPVDSPLERPGGGQIRVTLRTFSGDRSLLLKAADIRRPNHPLFKLYMGGQNVITAVREASAGRA